MNLFKENVFHFQIILSHHDFTITFYDILHIFTLATLVL